MAIFTHRDEDGDEFEIIERTRDSLMVSVAADMNRPSNAYVSRDAALRLHAALGQWLFPTYSGAPDTTLLERMVRQAAQDAVSAVLPLAARPGAGHKTVTGSGPCGDCLQGNHPHVFRPCERPGCQCPEFRDPEPRDVGHPEPGPTWDDQLWSRADPFDPESVGPCQELAPRAARLSDRCQGCGYAWALHRMHPPVCGCIRAADTDTGTQCPRCGHEHWSDTRCMHSREVEAPRRLVGCECGHRWGVHAVAEMNGGCTVCECTRSRGVQ